VRRDTERLRDVLEAVVAIDRDLPALKLAAARLVAELDVH
jgi:hypothetical protein